MARRPRQQRIEAYGKFRATRADDSAARRMQALAGLGATVAGVAEQFGRAKAEELAPAQAQEAVEQAITVDEEGQKVFGEVPTRKGYGADIFNAVALAGYDAQVENDVTNIVDSAKLQHPKDTQAYLNIVNGAIDGLTSTMSKDAKRLALSHFNQLNKTAFQNIQKEEIKINNDIALGEVNTAITNANSNISNLALEGRNEELKQALQNRNEYAEKYIKLGILDASNFAKEKTTINNAILKQSAIGKFNEILQDATITPQSRIKKAENALNNLKSQSTIAIENPINPEKRITLNPEQKETLEKDIEQNIKEFNDGQVKAAKEALEADELTQIANYSLALDGVQDSSISTEQKLFSINESEAKGQIQKEDAVLLRRYVNSAKALDAVTSSSDMGNILVRINDLNANLSLEPNSKEYLQGINNIRNEIINMRTTGNLSEEDEIKLNGQINNLTAAKIAGATVDIAYGFPQADRIIQNNLNTDLWGIARRELFYQVDAEIESGTFDNEIQKSNARKNLYNQKVNSVIDSIKLNQRTKAIELVDTLSVSSLPVITSQAEYDKLQSGNEYIFNGKKARKP